MELIHVSIIVLILVVINMIVYKLLKTTNKKWKDKNSCEVSKIKREFGHNHTAYMPGYHRIESICVYFNFFGFILFIILLILQIVNYII